MPDVENGEIFRQQPKQKSKKNQKKKNIQNQSNRPNDFVGRAEAARNSVGGERFGRAILGMGISFCSESEVDRQKFHNVQEQVGDITNQLALGLRRWFSSKPEFCLTPVLVPRHSLEKILCLVYLTEEPLNVV
jgi:hypothetical protein